MTTSRQRIIKRDVAAPIVYVIVVTYNTRDVARMCLSSLRGLTYEHHQIIVVDNGSRDGTEEMVRREFPEVAVIQTGKNLGYTGGNNRGIERALEEGAEYVLVLNPDTVVENARFVDELIAYAEAHADVGILGPRVFLRERGVVQNTVLFAPGLCRNLVHWMRYRLDRNFANLSGSSPVDAEVLNGVCLLLRATCLRQVGLFDENLFMYIEDADMDYRARRGGWSIRYVPIDSVIHLQKADGYGMTSIVNFLLKRNSVYFLRKIGRPLEAWALAFLSLAIMGVRTLRPARHETVADYVAFVFQLAKAYRSVLIRDTLDAEFGPPFRVMG